MTELVGFNHVVITVQDFEKTVRFYEETLRLPRLSRPALGWPGAWFKVGNSQLNVIQEVEGNEETRRHVALDAVDFDALVKDLQERGIKTTGGPGVYPSGMKWLRLHDPEGNIIEFVSDHRK